jgi:hypothetical protein
MIDTRRRSLVVLLSGLVALPAAAAWDPKKDKKDLDAAAAAGRATRPDRSTTKDLRRVSII